MKWIKVLLLGMLFTAALVGNADAQKLRFPTNVRYIAGGYIAKRPYFPTLETALNDVKAYATSSNPYVFWVDGDSLWIADWDSVFTASGITMKDSIDIYYVATGKIKWAGLLGGSGSSTAETTPRPDDTTYYYAWPNWDVSNGANPAWTRDIAVAFDSADAEINRLIVYTRSPLYIENDTLKIDTTGFTSDQVGWNPDTTRIVKIDVNSTLGATYTLSGLIQATGNGMLRLGVYHDGTTSRVMWVSDSLLVSPAGTDTEAIAYRSWVRSNFTETVTSDTNHFSGTNSSVDIAVSGGVSSDQYVVTPLLADSSTAINANDLMYVIPYNGGFYVKRGLGGTSELKFVWIRKPD